MGLAAGAAACFAVMAGCLKLGMTAGASLGEAVFVRSAVTAVVVGGVVSWRGLRVWAAPVRVLLVRSLFGGTAMVLGFWAVRDLPLGDAEVLRRSAPVFVVLLGWPVLGERPTVGLVGLVVLALAGTGLVVQPTFEVTWVPALAGLGAAVCAAGSFMSVRHLVRETPAAVVVFFFTGFVSLVSAPFVVGGSLDLEPLLFLLVAGACGTVGQMLMTHAYRFAMAGVVATAGYLTVVFATVLDPVLFGHVPPWSSLAGGALVAGSCVAVSLVRR